MLGGGADGDTMPKDILLQMLLDNLKPTATTHKIGQNPKDYKTQLKDYNT